MSWWSLPKYPSYHLDSLSDSYPFRQPLPCIGRLWLFIISHIITSIFVNKHRVVRTKLRVTRTIEQRTCHIHLITRPHLQQPEEVRKFAPQLKCEYRLCFPYHDGYNGYNNNKNYMIVFGAAGDSTLHFINPNFFRRSMAVWPSG